MLYKFLTVVLRKVFVNYSPLYFFFFFFLVSALLQFYVIFLQFLGCGNSFIERKKYILK